MQLVANIINLSHIIGADQLNEIKNAATLRGFSEATVLKKLIM